MGQNKLKYTGLTFDDIQAQITDLIRSDTKFDRFRESDIAQLLIEIFTGTTDITNYYLNRRAEECYFDTAQLKSSVISLSRMFGYVMNRKEPSHAYLKITIKGDIKDNQIQIPYYSKFSYGGDNFVLLNTMTYRIPETLYNTMNKDSEITITTDSYGKNIEIVQGDIREKVFNGSSNTQIGAPFQIYKIEDASFSNSYGDKDLFYNDVTQIYVGENKTEENKFEIDRRSLLNWETIDTSDLSQSKKTCVIRTTPDGFVEVLFGDGNVGVTNTQTQTQATGGFARKGALTRNDDIYVQYLSTKGKSSNKVGVLGDKVNYSGKIYNSNGEDITSKIKFELVSDIFGGADDESSDSIKYSSPKIYYSLDRLVASSDYTAFLKSLNSPINVKNALAWGEQQERNRAKSFALVKMFNTVLFSVIGSMYDLDGDKYFAKSGNGYADVVLDLNYDPHQFQTQGYFNVYIIQEMVNQLNRYKVLSNYYEVDSNDMRAIANDADATNTVLLDDIASEVKSKIEEEGIGSIATIGFSYTSDNRAMVSNIETSGEVEIQGLGSIATTGEQYLKDVADRINIQLLEFLDVRGNRTENDNFNQTAFDGRWVVDGSDNVLLKFEAVSTTDYSSYLYRARFSENTPMSPCYITTFGTIGDYPLLDILELSEKASFTVADTVEENEMNGKITSVITELDKRSQVNVKNIYLSPIIQRFNLIGDVYIKSLYDKEEVKREINNTIYEWLDTNADFNTPIYLSNLIEIIENHLGVINANVVLQPEYVTPNGIENPKTVTGELFYTPSETNNKILKRYTTEVADIVNDHLKKYLGLCDTTYDTWYSDYFVGIDTNEYPNTINERTFYFNFVSSLYNRFKGLLNNSCVECTDNAYRCANTACNINESDPSTCTNTEETVCTDENNYALFLGLISDIEQEYGSDVIHEVGLRSDFALIMEDIYKDLKYIIQRNMIDSYSNISREYDTNNNYVSGGYSLGSEIVQLELDGSYTDRLTENETKPPFLNFIYK